MSYPRISKRRAKRAGMGIVRTRKARKADTRFWPDTKWVTEIRWRGRIGTISNRSLVRLYGL